MFTKGFAVCKIVCAKGGAPLKPRRAGTWLTGCIVGLADSPFCF